MDVCLKSRSTRSYLEYEDSLSQNEKQTIFSACTEGEMKVNLSPCLSAHDSDRTQATHAVLCNTSSDSHLACFSATPCEGGTQLSALGGSSVTATRVKRGKRLRNLALATVQKPAELCNISDDFTSSLEGESRPTAGTAIYNSELCASDNTSSLQDMGFEIKSLTYDDTSSLQDLGFEIKSLTYDDTSSLQDMGFEIKSLNSQRDLYDQHSTADRHGFRCEQFHGNENEESMHTSPSKHCAGKGESTGSFFQFGDGSGKAVNRTPAIYNIGESDSTKQIGPVFSGLPSSPPLVQKSPGKLVRVKQTKVHTYLNYNKTRNQRIKELLKRCRLRYYVFPSIKTFLDSWFSKAQTNNCASDNAESTHLLAKHVHVAQNSVAGSHMDASSKLVSRKQVTAEGNARVLNQSRAFRHQSRSTGISKSSDEDNSECVRRSRTDKITTCSETITKDGNSNVRGQSMMHNRREGKTAYKNSRSLVNVHAKDSKGAPSVSGGQKRFTHQCVYVDNSIRKDKEQIVYEPPRKKPPEVMPKPKTSDLNSQMMQIEQEMKQFSTVGNDDNDAHVCFGTSTDILFCKDNSMKRANESRQIHVKKLSNAKSKAGDSDEEYRSDTIHTPCESHTFEEQCVFPDHKYQIEDAYCFHPEYKRHNVRIAGSALHISQHGEESISDAEDRARQLDANEAMQPTDVKVKLKDPEVDLHLLDRKEYASAEGRRLQEKANDCTSLGVRTIAKKLDAMFGGRSAAPSSGTQRLRKVYSEYSFSDNTGEESILNIPGTQLWTRSDEVIGCSTRKETTDTHTNHRIHPLPVHTEVIGASEKASTDNPNDPNSCCSVDDMQAVEPSEETLYDSSDSCNAHGVHSVSSVDGHKNTTGSICNRTPLTFLKELCDSDRVHTAGQKDKSASAHPKVIPFVGTMMFTPRTCPTGLYTETTENKTPPPFLKELKAALRRRQERFTVTKCSHHNSPANVSVSSHCPDKVDTQVASDSLTPSPLDRRLESNVHNGSIRDNLVLDNRNCLTPKQVSNVSAKPDNSVQLEIAHELMANIKSPLTPTVKKPRRSPKGNMCPKQALLNKSTSKCKLSLMSYMNDATKDSQAERSQCELRTMDHSAAAHCLTKGDSATGITSSNSLADFLSSMFDDKEDTKWQAVEHTFVQNDPIAKNTPEKEDQETSNKQYVRTSSSDSTVKKLKVLGSMSQGWCFGHVFHEHDLAKLQEPSADHKTTHAPNNADLSLTTLSDVQNKKSPLTASHDRSQAEPERTSGSSLDVSLALKPLCKQRFQSSSCVHLGASQLPSGVSVVAEAPSCSAVSSLEVIPPWPVWASFLQRSPQLQEWIPVQYSSSDTQNYADRMLSPSYLNKSRQSMMYPPMALVASNNAVCGREDDKQLSETEASHEISDMLVYNDTKSEQTRKEYISNCPDQKLINTNVPSAQWSNGDRGNQSTTKRPCNAVSNLIKKFQTATICERQANDLTLSSKLSLQIKNGDNLKHNSVSDSALADTHLPKVTFKIEKPKSVGDAPSKDTLRMVPHIMSEMKDLAPGSGGYAKESCSSNQHLNPPLGAVRAERQTAYVVATPPPSDMFHSLSAASSKLSLNTACSNTPRQTPSTMFVVDTKYIPNKCAVHNEEANASPKVKVITKRRPSVIPRSHLKTSYLSPPLDHTHLMQKEHDDSDECRIPQPIVRAGSPGPGPSAIHTNHMPRLDRESKSSSNCSELETIPKDVENTSKSTDLWLPTEEAPTRQIGKDSQRHNQTTGYVAHWLSSVYSCDDPSDSPNTETQMRMQSTSQEEQIECSYTETISTTDTGTSLRKTYSSNSVCEEAEINQLQEATTQTNGPTREKDKEDSETRTRLKQRHDIHMSVFSIVPTDNGTVRKEEAYAPVSTSGGISSAVNGTETPASEFVSCTGLKDSVGSDTGGQTLSSSTGSFASAKSTRDPPVIDQFLPLSKQEHSQNKYLQNKVSAVKDERESNRKDGMEQSSLLTATESLRREGLRSTQLMGNMQVDTQPLSLKKRPELSEPSVKMLLNSYKVIGSFIGVVLKHQRSKTPVFMNEVMRCLDARRYNETSPGNGESMEGSEKSFIATKVNAINSTENTANYASHVTMTSPKNASNIQLNNEFEPQSYASPTVKSNMQVTNATETATQVFPSEKSCKLHALRQTANLSANQKSRSDASEMTLNVSKRKPHSRRTSPCQVKHKLDVNDIERDAVTEGPKRPTPAPGDGAPDMWQNNNFPGPATMSAVTISNRGPGIASVPLQSNLLMTEKTLFCPFLSKQEVIRLAMPPYQSAMMTSSHNARRYSEVTPLDDAMVTDISLPNAPEVTQSDNILLKQRRLTFEQPSDTLLSLSEQGTDCLLSCKIQKSENVVETSKTLNEVENALNSRKQSQYKAQHSLEKMRIKKEDTLAPGQLTGTDNHLISSLWHATQTRDCLPEGETNTSKEANSSPYDEEIAHIANRLQYRISAPRKHRDSKTHSQQVNSEKTSYHCVSTAKHSTPYPYLSADMLSEDTPCQPESECIPSCPDGVAQEHQHQIKVDDHMPPGRQASNRDRFVREVNTETDGDYEKNQQRESEHKRESLTLSCAFFQEPGPEPVVREQALRHESSNTTEKRGTETWDQSNIHFGPYDKAGQVNYRSTKPSRYELQFGEFNPNVRELEDSADLTPDARENVDNRYTAGDTTDETQNRKICLLISLLEKVYISLQKMEQKCEHKSEMNTTQSKRESSLNPSSERTSFPSETEDNTLKNLLSNAIQTVNRLRTQISSPSSLSSATDSSHSNENIDLHTCQTLLKPKQHRKKTETLKSNKCGQISVCTDTDNIKGKKKVVEQCLQTNVTHDTRRPPRPLGACAQYNAYTSTTYNSLPKNDARTSILPNRIEGNTDMPEICNRIEEMLPKHTWSKDDREFLGKLEIMCRFLPISSNSAIDVGFIDRWINTFTKQKTSSGGVCEHGRSHNYDTFGKRCTATPSNEGSTRTSDCNLCSDQWTPRAGDNGKAHTVLPSAGHTAEASHVGTGVQRNVQTVDLAIPPEIRSNNGKEEEHLIEYYSPLGAAHGDNQSESKDTRQECKAINSTPSVVNGKKDGPCETCSGNKQQRDRPYTDWYVVDDVLPQTFHCMLSPSRTTLPATSPEHWFDQVRCVHRASHDPPPSGVSAYTILEHPQWDSVSGIDAASDVQEAGQVSHSLTSNSQMKSQGGQIASFSDNNNDNWIQGTKRMVRKFEQISQQFSDSQPQDHLSDLLDNRSPYLFHSFPTIAEPTNKKQLLVPQHKPVVYTLGPSSINRNLDTIVQQEETLCSTYKHRRVKQVTTAKLKSTENANVGPTALHPYRRWIHSASVAERLQSPTNASVPHRKSPHRSAFHIAAKQGIGNVKGAKGYALVKRGSVSTWSEPVHVDGKLVSPSLKMHHHFINKNAEKGYQLRKRNMKEIYSNINMNGSPVIQTYTETDRHRVHVVETRTKVDHTVDSETSGSQSYRYGVSPLDEASAVYVSLCVVSETIDPLTGRPILKVTGTDTCNSGGPLQPDDMSYRQSTHDPNDNHVTGTDTCNFGGPLQPDDMSYRQSTHDPNDNHVTGTDTCHSGGPLQSDDMSYRQSTHDPNDNHVTGTDTCHSGGPLQSDDMSYRQSTHDPNDNHVKASVLSNRMGNKSKECKLQKASNKPQHNTLSRNQNASDSSPERSATNHISSNRSPSITFSSDSQSLSPLLAHGPNATTLNSAGTLGAHGTSTVFSVMRTKKPKGTASTAHKVSSTSSALSTPACSSRENMSVREKIDLFTRKIKNQTKRKRPKKPLLETVKTYKQVKDICQIYQRMVNIGFNADMQRHDTKTCFHMLANSNQLHDENVSDQTASNICKRIKFLSEVTNSKCSVCRSKVPTSCPNMQISVMDKRHDDDSHVDSYIQSPCTLLEEGTQWNDDALTGDFPSSHESAAYVSGNILASNELQNKEAASITSREQIKRRSRRLKHDLRQLEQAKRMIRNNQPTEHKAPSIPATSSIKVTDKCTNATIQSIESRPKVDASSMALSPDGLAAVSKSPDPRIDTENVTTLQHNRVINRKNEHSAEMANMEWKAASPRVIGNSEKDSKQATEGVRIHQQTDRPVPQLFSEKDFKNTREISPLSIQIKSNSFEQSSPSCSFGNTNLSIFSIRSRTSAMQGSATKYMSPYSCHSPQNAKRQYPISNAGRNQKTASGQYLKNVHKFPPSSVSNRAVQMNPVNVIVEHTSPKSSTSTPNESKNNVISKSSTSTPNESKNNVISKSSTSTPNESKNNAISNAKYAHACAKQGIDTKSCEEGTNMTNTHQTPCSANVCRYYDASEYCQDHLGKQPVLTLPTRFASRSNHENETERPNRSTKVKCMHNEKQPPTQEMSNEINLSRSMLAVPVSPMLNLPKYIGRVAGLFWRSRDSKNTKTVCDYKLSTCNEALKRKTRTPRVTKSFQREVTQANTTSAAYVETECNPSSPFQNHGLPQFSNCSAASAGKCDEKRRVCRLFEKNQKLCEKEPKTRDFDIPRDTGNMQRKEVTMTRCKSSKQIHHGLKSAFGDGSNRIQEQSPCRNLYKLTIGLEVGDDTRSDSVSSDKQVSLTVGNINVSTNAKDHSVYDYPQSGHEQARLSGSTAGKQIPMAVFAGQDTCHIQHLSKLSADNESKSGRGLSIEQMKRKKSITVNDNAKAFYKSQGKWNTNGTVCERSGQKVTVHENTSIAQTLNSRNEPSSCESYASLAGSTHLHPQKMTREPNKQHGDAVLYDLCHNHNSSSDDSFKTSNRFSDQEMIVRCHERHKANDSKLQEDMDVTLQQASSEKFVSVNQPSSKDGFVTHMVTKSACVGKDNGLQSSSEDEFTYDTCIVNSDQVTDSKMHVNNGISNRKPKKRNNREKQPKNDTDAKCIELKIVPGNLNSDDLPPMGIHGPAHKSEHCSNTYLCRKCNSAQSEGSVHNLCDTKNIVTENLKKTNEESTNTESKRNADEKHKGNVQSEATDSNEVELILPRPTANRKQRKPAGQDKESSRTDSNSNMKTESVQTKGKKEGKPSCEGRHKSCKCTLQPLPVAKIEILKPGLDTHCVTTTTTVHGSPRVHKGDCFYDTREEEEIAFASPIDRSPNVIDRNEQKRSKREIIHKETANLTANILKRCVDIAIKTLGTKEFDVPDTDRPERNQFHLAHHHTRKVDINHVYPQQNRRAKKAKKTSPSTHGEPHTMPGKVCRSEKFFRPNDKTTEIKQKTQKVMTSIEAANDRVNCVTARTSSLYSPTAGRKRESLRFTSRGNNNMDVFEHENCSTRKQSSSKESRHCTKASLGSKSCMLTLAKHCHQINMPTTPKVDVKETQKSTKHRSTSDANKYVMNAQDPFSSSSFELGSEFDIECDSPSLDTPYECSSSDSLSDESFLKLVQSCQPKKKNHSNSPDRKAAVAGVEYTQATSRVSLSELLCSGAVSNMFPQKESHKKTRVSLKHSPGCQMERPAMIRSACCSQSTLQETCVKHIPSLKHSLTTDRKPKGCSVGHCRPKHRASSVSFRSSVSDCSLRANIFSAFSKNNNRGSSRQSYSCPCSCQRICKDHKTRTESGSLSKTGECISPRHNKGDQIAQLTFSQVKDDDKKVRTGVHRQCLLLAKADKDKDQNSNTKTTKFRILAEPRMGKKTSPSFKIEVSPPSVGSSDESVRRVVKLEETLAPDPSAKLTMTEFKSHETRANRGALQHSFPTCAFNKSRTKIGVCSISSKIKLSSVCLLSSSTSTDTSSSGNRELTTVKQKIYKKATSTDGNVAEFKVQATSPPRTSPASSPRVYRVDAAIKNKDNSPRKVLSYSVSRSQVYCAVDDTHSGINSPSAWCMRHGDKCIQNKSPTIALGQLSLQMSEHSCRKDVCPCHTRIKKKQSETLSPLKSEVIIQECHKHKRSSPGNGLSASKVTSSVLMCTPKKVTLQRGASPTRRMRHGYANDNDSDYVETEQVVCSVSQCPCFGQHKKITQFHIDPKRRRKQRTVITELISNDSAMDVMSEALVNLKQKPQKKNNERHSSRGIQNFRLAQKSSTSVVSVFSDSCEGGNQLKTTHNLSVKRNTKLKRLSCRESTRRQLRTRWILRAQEKLSRLAQKTQMILRSAIQATRREIIEERNRSRQRQLQKAMKSVQQKRLLLTSRQSPKQSVISLIQQTDDTSSSSETPSCEMQSSTYQARSSLNSARGACSCASVSQRATQSISPEGTSSELCTFVSQVSGNTRTCCFCSGKTCNAPLLVTQPVVDKLCSSCIQLTSDGRQRTLKSTWKRKNAGDRCTTTICKLNSGNHCSPRKCCSSQSVLQNCAFHTSEFERVCQRSKSDSSISYISVTTSTETVPRPVVRRHRGAMTVRSELSVSTDRINLLCPRDRTRKAAPQQSAHVSSCPLARKGKDSQCKDFVSSNKTHRTHIVQTHKEYLSHLQQLAKRLACDAVRDADMHRAGKGGKAMASCRLRLCQSRTETRYLLTLNDVSRMVAAVCMTASEQGITRRWLSYCSMFLQPGGQLSLTRLNTRHDIANNSSSQSESQTLHTVLHQSGLSTRPVASHTACQCQTPQETRNTKDIRLGSKTVNSISVMDDLLEQDLPPQGKGIKQTCHNKVHRSNGRHHNTAALQARFQDYSNGWMTDVSISTLETSSTDDDSVRETRFQTDNITSPQITSKDRRSVMTNYKSCCSFSTLPKSKVVGAVSQRAEQDTYLSESIISPKAQAANARLCYQSHGQGCLQRASKPWGHKPAKILQQAAMINPPLDSDSCQSGGLAVATNCRIKTHSRHPQCNAHSTYQEVNDKESTEYFSSSVSTESVHHRQDRRVPKIFMSTLSEDVQKSLRRRQQRRSRLENKSTDSYTLKNTNDYHTNVCPSIKIQHSTYPYGDSSGAYASIHKQYDELDISPGQQNRTPKKTRFVTSRFGPNISRREDYELDTEQLLCSKTTQKNRHDSHEPESSESSQLEIFNQDCQYGTHFNRKDPTSEKTRHVDGCPRSGGRTHDFLADIKTTSYTQVRPKHDLGRPSRRHKYQDDFHSHRAQACRKNRSCKCDPEVSLHIRNKANTFNFHDDMQKTHHRHQCPKQDDLSSRHRLASHTQHVRCDKHEHNSPNHSPSNSASHQTGLRQKSPVYTSRDTNLLISPPAFDSASFTFVGMDDHPAPPGHCHADIPPKQQAEVFHGRPTRNRKSMSRKGRHHNPAMATFTNTDLEEQHASSPRGLKSEVRLHVDRNMQHLCRDRPQDLGRLSYQHLLQINNKVLNNLQTSSRWDAESVNRAFRDTVYQCYIKCHQPDLCLTPKNQCTYCSKSALGKDNH